MSSDFQKELRPQVAAAAACPVKRTYYVTPSVRGTDAERARKIETSIIDSRIHRIERTALPSDTLLASLFPLSSMG